MSAPLGLPPGIAACLFDLDGVLTRTTPLHAAAWKEMFDHFLRRRAAQTGERFVAFDAVTDYLEYVDGKHRHDGVSSFLASRGVTLPAGAPDDPPDRDTPYGLGNRKDALVLGLIRSRGVDAYGGSVRYVEAARAAGLRTAVVSASQNCAEVLAAAGIAGLFEVRIDGVVAAQENLAGKPAPDPYLAAARSLGVTPERSAVFEDSLAGVEAGRAGAFGYVVGVDRGGRAAALREHGADLVVSDLGDLLAPATKRLAARAN